MPENFEIDNLDLQILSLLMENAQLPYTEIAKKIFVSGGTVHVRMKKLINMGIVKGSQMLIDYTKLGYDITAFLGVYLEKNSLYDEVAEDLKNIPEIIELHYTTGNYSMFVKIMCKDTQHLREVLHDKVQNIKGIERTETFIALDESINRPVNLLQELQ